VPEVVRGECRDAGCGAGSGERGPEAVAAEALEDPSVGNAILAALIGGHVGQRNLATANAYSHVLADEAELDYAGLLGHQGGWDT